MSPSIARPLGLDTDRARHGATVAGERARGFPCDRHLSDPDDAYFRAIDIAAPPAVVFRWLCQLRVAPYSYDLLDNFGRRSPRRLTPGLERLERGQRFMTIFELVDFEPSLQITLLTSRWQRIFGSVAGTYLIQPGLDGDCRLLVKLLVRHPGGRAESYLRSRLLPWGDLIMMEKQLRTLKRLAETTADAARTPELSPAASPPHRDHPKP